jgi:hypothetical protein
MARIRTIKPEFFNHEELFDLEAETKLPLRIAFAGLWTVCDREGRFKWRPRSIKAQVLPYDDVDFSRVLDALTTRGFVVKYASNGVEYGHVPGFGRHQVVNNREAASVLPKPPETPQNTGNPRVPDACGTREPREGHAGAVEGNGKEVEGNGKEGDSTEPEIPATVPVFDPTACQFPEFPASGDVKTWEATAKQLAAWQEAYPGVDVAAEHRRAHAWIMANLTKRKTTTGYPKFLNSWMGRVQDRGGGGTAGTPNRPKTFKEIDNDNFNAAFDKVFKNESGTDAKIIDGAIQGVRHEA